MLTSTSNKLREEVVDVTKSACDFLLVAALPKEFRPAIYKVFNAQRIPKERGDARNYYRCVQSTQFGRQYELRLFCVGRQGGQNTASAVTQAVKKWQPNYVIMFGIAAVQPGGNRKPGHLLVSDWIADFEEARKGVKKEAQPRPLFWHCERELFSHMEELEEQFERTVHVGCIISQPNLSRSAKYRDSLVKHVKNFLNRDIVVGLEMEGGGLAKAIDGLPHELRAGFILIKGAVDWGNYHKNDAFQPKMVEEVSRFVADFLRTEPVIPGIEARTFPPLRLLPDSEYNTNGVSLGDERHKENGKFRVWATFYLIVGQSNLELISLWIGYYAQGCLCYEDAGTVALGSQTFQSVFGHLNSSNPLKLQTETTYQMKYSGSHRPPLMQQTPSSIYAEYGDLVIEAKIRVSGEYDFRLMRWVFRLDPSSHPEGVPEVRDPPRLTNSELEAFRAAGRISAKSFQQLLTVNPRKRYLASIHRTESAVTQDIPRGTLELLRILYREGPPGEKDC